MPDGADIQAVATLVRTTARAAVAVHEDPDLDALGAAGGLIDLLQLCGGHGVLRVRPGTELPRCDWFLDLSTVQHGPPAAAETLFVVDSGSLERTALDLEGWAGTVVNIDHHPDNERFGDVALVRPAASSASELVCLVAEALGIVPTPRGAAALYTGILFDTGHFRHASTGAAALRAAAAMVEAGARPDVVYREVYEDRTLADLHLWARAVANAVPLAGGRALVSVLNEQDIAACGGSDRAGGVVETLRSARGVEVAALVRAEPRRSVTKVSLRSVGFDVGALARSRGGGGHRMAAGFTTDESPEEVAAWLSTELDACLSTASC
ncbi:MAG: DHH family phosphoesterase [Actinobacteria bacterium]|nr:DHH family phosphoesterase [Actinomycetota bacterium]